MTTSDKKLKVEAVWDLDVMVRATHRVCFEEPVTLAEAMVLYEEGKFEDVVDERDQTIVEVLGGE